MPRQTSESFLCRDCGHEVYWAESKTGKRYLAQPLYWHGDEYGTELRFSPSHRCTPDPEYQQAQAERRAATEARKAHEAELREAGVHAPAGRVLVTGEVTSLKLKESLYGNTWKMLVLTDEGWKVYVTVPKDLMEPTWMTLQQPDGLPAVKEGDRVEFTATVEPSDDDPLFAFGKRPTKARALTAA